MFVLEQVSKRFGGTQALHPLDLHVPEGRTTVLLGPSGCGKSTLERLMNGLLRPDTGRVLFRGTAPARQPHARADARPGRAPARRATRCRGTCATSSPGFVSGLFELIERLVVPRGLRL